MKYEINYIVPDVEAVVRDVLEGLPPLVPLELAAERLGVSASTLRRWIGLERLLAVRTTDGGSGRVLIPRAEIERELRRMLDVD